MERAFINIIVSTTNDIVDMQITPLNKEDESLSFKKVKYLLHLVVPVFIYFN